MTQCKVKSPAFVSRPHFHLADPYYAEQFQYGVHSDPNLHESFFWLEAKSSIPIKVEMRLQLNILLQSVPGMEYLFKDLQQVMFPVMWFDSVAAVPEDMAGSLRLLISLPVMFRVSICCIFCLADYPAILTLEYACLSVCDQKTPSNTLSTG